MNVTFGKDIGQKRTEKPVQALPAVSKITNMKAVRHVYIMLQTWLWGSGNLISVVKFMPQF
jgi:hypothetical protein